MIRVLVVGDIITDVIAIHSGALVIDSDTPARISMSGGGSAGNTAAWLAYVGCLVDMVAVAGDDLAGTDRLAELAGAGVGCTAVRQTPDAPTATVIVLVRGEHRTMLTDRGAARTLQSSDVDSAFDALPDVRHLHLSGYVLLDEPSRPAGLHALSAARRRGATTSVDAASAAPLRHVGGAAFLEWIRDTDLLLANVDEASALLGSTPRPTLGPTPTSTTDAERDTVEPDTVERDTVELARALASTVARVAVKRGGDGAVWADQDGNVVSEPAAPATLVDPTGAGDAFAAGLLNAWLTGADPATAVRAGVRLGARAVALAGGRPPRRPGSPS